MVTQVSMLAAVLDGHEEPLREAIAAIPLGGESPFASVAGTHNGRWVVVMPKPIAPHTMLMCSATIDRSADDWLRDFLHVLGPTADTIWSHCAGWPAEASRRAPWLTAHRVHSSLSFATWDVPVTTIIEALATHSRISRLAVRSQGLDPAALLAAYREDMAR